jgi:hypothetical protein
VTLYLSAFGVLAERFGHLGGPQRWTNYLTVGGRMMGIQVENADESTATRYFHLAHLGSVSVITNEAGVVVERLSVACPRVREAEPGERLGPAPQPRRPPPTRPAPSRASRAAASPATSTWPRWA